MNRPREARDQDRRLSPKGLRHAEALGEALGADALGLPAPSCCSYSPAVRTQQTAEVCFPAGTA